MPGPVDTPRGRRVQVGENEWREQVRLASGAWADVVSLAAYENVTVYEVAPGTSGPALDVAWAVVTVDPASLLTGMVGDGPGFPLAPSDPPLVLPVTNLSAITAGSGGAPLRVLAVH